MRKVTSAPLSFHSAGNPGSPMPWRFFGFDYLRFLAGRSSSPFSSAASTNDSPEIIR